MKFTSQVYSAASGSIGGITYSRNRGGMYTRARAVPTNPNSVRQVAARAGFSAAVRLWTEDLTGAQRDGWRTYADATPFTDSLGSPLVLTGQQAFVRSISALIGAGIEPSNLSAPTIFNTGPFTPTGGSGASYTPATNIFEFDFSSWDGLTADVAFALIQVGLPANLSANGVPSRFRLGAGGTVNTGNPTLEFLSPWPSSEGKNVTFKVRLYRVDNRLSEAVLLRLAF